MPQVFINHRRSLDAFTAKAIEDAIARELPHVRVFRDQSSIGHAEDFLERIRAEMADTDLVLALVSPHWAARFAEPAGGDVDAAAGSLDHVEAEIRLALDSGVSILRVLISGAEFRTVEPLPASLRALAGRHAARLEATDPSLRDLTRLCDRMLAERSAARTGAASRPLSIEMLRDPALELDLRAYEPGARLSLGAARIDREPLALRLLCAFFGVFAIGIALAGLGFLALTAFAALRGLILGQPVDGSAGGLMLFFFIPFAGLLSFFGLFGVGLAETATRRRRVLDFVLATGRLRVSPLHRWTRLVDPELRAGDFDVALQKTPEGWRGSLAYRGGEDEIHLLIRTRAQQEKARARTAILNVAGPLLNAIGFTRVSVREGDPARPGEATPADPA